ncbi:MAG TPA: ZIP family metal transporter [Candidatus Acidoferrum sp.]|jgi:zinc transporter ZupT|nr:ZIP family metal transporter [Candidatus Acidoferrum sp.]
MSANLLTGYVVLAFALAVSGGALGAFLGTSHQRLCALISLGAGSLLGVTVFAILPESFEGLRWWGVLLALGSGYGVFALVSKYVYHVCPACAASHFDEATAHRFSEIASAMMLALAIHCIADGVALAAGHEAHASEVPGGRMLDFSLVLAVCVHKVPEGLALGALLLGAGFRPAEVVLRVAAVESTTLLGGVLGRFFLQRIGDVWLDAVVAHVGGGFLFLASHAVAGEISKHHKALVLLSFGIGLGVIGILTLLLRLQ